MIIDGKQLRDIDPIDASVLTAEHGCIIIKNSNASQEEYAEWMLEFGYHIKPNIWCSEKDKHGIFWRVTNDKVDEENEGLFGNNPIEWHSDMTPFCDSQEVVGLYAKRIEFPTATWVCTSVPYWDTLDKSTQETMKNLYTVTEMASEHPPMNQQWTAEWDIKYSETVINDIRKNRQLSTIKNCINIDAETLNKFKDARGIAKRHRLVPNHPVIGRRGFCFQPYEIAEILLNDKPYEHASELYDMLFNDWLLSDKYTIKHEWNNGDIILMDQLTTLHTRPALEHGNKIRELLRSACWYNSAARTHYDYVL